MPDNRNQDLMPYNLFYCDGTLLAQNIDGHIIELGQANVHDGLIGYHIDGSDLHGENYSAPEELLEDLGEQLDFLFLDGQFTSLPDVSERWLDRLEDAPVQLISLHELESGTEEENPVPTSDEDPGIRND
ncbi:hypothetical protein M1E08_10400 [Erwinia sp. PK3-005]|uniref:Uncharacterized protein n=1 Tax=Mixta hanseatica TaxID=2872648 RepID=A0ABY4R670_9GAMM|nr:hypothetical protein [Mixta hanseatica]UQY42412.1 hypothetical protein K6958_10595 [Mixta hanseatica]